MWSLLLACSTVPPDRDEPRCEPYVSDDARLRAIGEAAPGWLYEPTDFEPLCRPEPGDWLAWHPEPGQSVERFMRDPRRVPDGPLVLVPLGQALDDSLVELLAEVLGVDVEVRDLGIDRHGLPGRIHPQTGAPQLFTPGLLARLEEALPDDAFAVLGVTSVDLAPSEDWNFVFGQASYTGGVGLFSTARHRPADEALERRRALHTLSHEALHMMGLQHCPYFACAMNGSNSLDESDRTPLDLCPVCLRKLEIATGVDLVARYARLAELYRREGLVSEADAIEARLRTGAGR